MEIQVYKVLGVMSGTSLDGLDIAYCEFVKGDYWSYRIVQAATIPYSEKRENILRNARLLSAEELIALDRKYGKYIGEECRKFVYSNHLTWPMIISSHGHTVFHQPQKGFTLQIGHGSCIFAETGVPVVSDFRSQDVALGGQGAPLVPVGDMLLFGNFSACLNLGGFANISMQNDNNRIAWDICAVNIVLNYYANKLGFAFDKGGAIAKSGNLHEGLFKDLQTLDFYKEPPPKSLGIEWVNEYLLPILEKYPISPADILNTYVSHIAEQLGTAINKNEAKAVFVTGGGAYNHFLIEKIKERTKAEIIIPDDSILKYKEALIFAFLGLLRWRGEINVLSSVTGARKNHSSGAIYGQG